MRRGKRKGTSQKGLSTSQKGASTRQTERKRARALTGVASKEVQGVAATVHRWSVALGKNEKTLQSLFTRAGLSLPERGGMVPAADVVRALFGDDHAEKVRNLKADADRKEREEREAMGRLFDVDHLKQWVVGWTAGMRQAIDVAPDGVSKEWAEKVLIPAMMKPAEDTEKL